MTLRTRLIAAFLLLSVVPLGAVTFYNYRTNVEAMRQVAAHEGDVLAGVMNQRMQLITAQLSERMDRLIDDEAPADTAAPAPAAPPAAPTTAEQEQFGRQAADALGEAAILLNTVQVQGLSRFGGPGRGGPRPPSSATGQAPPRGANAGPPPSSRGTGAPPTGSPPPRPSTRGEQVVIQPSQQAAPNQPPPPDVPLLVPSSPTTPRIGPVPPASTGASASSSSTTSATAPPATSAASGQTTISPDATTAIGPGGIQIDLTQMRRDLYRQILPDAQADTLTPEERQRIGREVNQRLLGIVEGIKLSAAELQKKADEAKKAAALEATHASSGAKPKAASAAPAAPPTPVTHVMSPPNAATTRTRVLSGNHLTVRYERNGQVVHSINAEINLPNLLMTIFTAMSREKGEIPFAIDKDGRIYAPSEDDRRRVELLGLTDVAIGTTYLPDWIIVTTNGPAGSALRFGIARPVGDSLIALRETAARNVGFGLGAIVLLLIGVVPLSTRLTRNLTKLTEGVDRIAKGDYAARVDVRGGDEVSNLAHAFNLMAADVEKHQRAAVEQERIKRELELGRQIQHDMLPHGPLRHGRTEIVGVSVPAREVGGDFFNYFEIANGQIALLVGDVSGKGVGAALLMANLQASLRTRLALGQDLAAVADEIDRDIEHNAPETLYATLFISTFDPESRRFRYVNCGHHPQFVLRHDGRVERLSSTGLPVGLLAGRGYREVDVALEPNDRLLFYTDGCVEAENEAGDFFGASRLEAAVAAKTDNPEEMLAHVERAVEAFRGTRELMDDVTVMAVRIG